MHDGVYGRSHLYSYVNDNGTWWKTVDWVVTEASDVYLLDRKDLNLRRPPLQVSEEAVLTDPTGFHLGAGPYMLIYSRAIPESDQEPLQWPDDVMVRDSAISLFLLLSYAVLFLYHYSGPFSATISFFLEILRRVLLVPPRVKPSKYLSHRLLPYPASLRPWKCPSLL